MCLNTFWSTHTRVATEKKGFLICFLDQLPNPPPTKITPLPNCRNAQAGDICSDLSVKLAGGDSWREIKDVQSTRKDYSQDVGVGGVLADLSNTTDAQVRGLRGRVLRVGVCAHACGPVCIIQCAVVLPHTEHSRDDCL